MRYKYLPLDAISSFDGAFELQYQISEFHQIIELVTEPLLAVNPLTIWLHYERPSVGRLYATNNEP